MSGDHHQLANEASVNVDPRMLADALAHIMRTAARSSSQTRRVRWIEQRALFALQGRTYDDALFDLPKRPADDSSERLQRRMAYHIAVKHQLLEAANKAMRECVDLLGTPAGDALQAAIDNVDADERAKVAAGAKAAMPDQRDELQVALRRMHRSADKLMARLCAADPTFRPTQWEGWHDLVQATNVLLNAKPIE